MHLTVELPRLGGGGDGGGGNHCRCLGALGHQQGSHLETAAGDFDTVTSKMFDGNNIDAIGFIEVLVFVDEEQVALFEGDGLLVATQVLIITPTNLRLHQHLHQHFLHYQGHHCID